MESSERITTILVDTCAFRDANSDFAGISKQLLPSFFASIEEKELVLLNHPILTQEIKKHIADSGLCKDFQGLISQIRKCTDVLKFLDCYDDNLFSFISQINIQEKIYESFKQHYRHAVELEYVDPALIFDLYFNGTPPFALTSKKKYEFPDAFVIEAAKQYLEEHPNDVLLVVTKDEDWISAFKDNKYISICSSITEAIKKINGIECILSNQMLSEIFHGVYAEIVSCAQKDIEYECFEIEDFEVLNEIEIESVKVESICDDYVPLKVTRNSILISTTITLQVTGRAEIFDEDNSLWDNENREYIFQSYADAIFTDAEATVECEVEISFDFDDPEHTAYVDSFKLTNSSNILVNSKCVDIFPIDDHDFAIRVLREDKGLPRRLKS